MEALKVLRYPLEAAKFVGHTLLGGAWGALGDRYGGAVGGHEPHPASITFVSTGEAPKE